MVADIFAEKPILKGERVILRPFVPDDLAAMGRILADPEVLRLTGSVHSTVEAQSQPDRLDERTVQWYETRGEQPDRLDLAIVPVTGGDCVGEAVLNELHMANDTCGFRILIGPAGRDRGFGSEATRLIIDHAFDTTELNRIELEVFAFNPRARRVYEKAGFRYEGTRRDALKFDDEYVDAIDMAILRREWKSQRTS
ncbi:MAG TPA: GNAT family protein [Mycobacteriales bacterium]|nr:GNAT family protein [Mycobacteriales bacterium]